MIVVDKTKPLGLTALHPDPRRVLGSYHRIAKRSLASAP
jgi:hypothetical protein